LRRYIPVPAERTPQPHEGFFRRVAASKAAGATAAHQQQQQHTSSSAVQLTAEAAGGSGAESVIRGRVSTVSTGFGSFNSGDVRGWDAAPISSLSEMKPPTPARVEAWQAWQARVIREHVVRRCRLTR